MPQFIKFIDSTIILTLVKHLQTPIVESLVNVANQLKVQVILYNSYKCNILIRFSPHIHLI